MKVVNIEDLKEGQRVLGPDGKFYAFKPGYVQTKPLYKVTTEAGSNTCSYDHQWTIFTPDPQVLSVIEMHNDIGKYIGAPIGVPDGPRLSQIEYVGIGECMCIDVDSEEHQFAILTDRKEQVFTHNCQLRIGCGRLESNASRMAFDDTSGCSVDGSKKGAGLVSSNSVKVHTQFYFCDGPQWIRDWFKDHGFDEQGYAEVESSEIDLGDDMEEITITTGEQVFEFEDNKAEIADRQEQRFEQV